MAIVFDIVNTKAHYNVNTMQNRRASMRQTEEMRNKVFAKYQNLVGTIYKNSLAARRAANAELNDPNKHEEYWDKDTKPRKTLNMSSSCFAKIIPAAGGAFLYFRSNPEKGYFYPCGGTTASTAKRIEELMNADSIGSAYLGGWGAKNGARKVMSKSGRSYSYKLNGGKTLNLKKFDAIGKRLGG